jgi:hypothetical protein
MVVRKNVLEFIIALVVVKKKVRLKNNFARLGEKKSDRKIKRNNSYVMLDIEWNISDFICKEK